MKGILYEVKQLIMAGKKTPETVQAPTNSTKSKKKNVSFNRRHGSPPQEADPALEPHLPLGFMFANSEVD